MRRADERHITEDQQCTISARGVTYACTQAVGLVGLRRVGRHDFKTGKEMGHVCFAGHCDKPFKARLPKRARGMGDKGLAPEIRQQLVFRPESS